jgi:hypothetical protein
MAARLSVLRTGQFLPPGRFLVLISVRRWVDPRAIVRPEGLVQLKKSTSSRTWTGDLQACSIVPEPTMLPRVPKCKVIPVQDVEVLRVARGWGSHIFRHLAHKWRQGCQPYAPAAFYPQGDSWYSFLLEAESTSGP